MHYPSRRFLEKFSQNGRNGEMEKGVRDAHHILPPPPHET
jgi:hypothetical protein